MFTNVSFSSYLFLGQIFAQLWLGTMCENGIPSHLHTLHTQIHVFFFFSYRNVNMIILIKKGQKSTTTHKKKNPLKMFVYLESSLHYFSLFASTFFSLHLSPTVSRMQFQHWLFLSGLKHLNTNYLHSKPWSLFSRPQKCQERQNFLSFIFTHMH